MNSLEAALLEVSTYFDESGVGYMVIGGFANLHWGAPRLTEDIDVTVRVEESMLPDFVSRLCERFQPLHSDPVGFALRHGVIPVKGAAGVRVDVVLESHPMVSRAIDRAVAIDVAGVPVRLCTAEDLILHKLVSERPRDLEDVKGVILRQATSLDRNYLDPLVEELAAALERAGISKFYRECLSMAGVASAVDKSRSSLPPSKSARRPDSGERRGPDG